MAKIERAETVADAETLNGIIPASDAVMVERGDLVILSQGDTDRV